MAHWKVSYMRRGSEPPYPFGKTSTMVCADTRDEAKAAVPASPRYPITASKTHLQCGALTFCRCHKLGLAQ
jgi:hypothetical protein